MIPRKSLVNSKFLLFNNIEKSPYVGTKFYKDYPIVKFTNILPKHNGNLGYFIHSNLSNQNLIINNTDTTVINNYFDPELLLKVGKKLNDGITFTDIKKIHISVIKYIQIFI